MDISRIAQGVDINLGKANLKGSESESKDKCLENKELSKNNHYDEKEFKELIDKANQILVDNSTHLQFKIHEKTHAVMVKIVNDATGEVLKEIPPEKIIDMIAKMCENAGVFLNTKK